MTRPRTGEELRKNYRRTLPTKVFGRCRVCGNLAPCYPTAEGGVIKLQAHDVRKGLACLGHWSRPTLVIRQDS